MATSPSKTIHSNQLRSVIENDSQKRQQLDKYLKHQVFTTRPWIPSHNQPITEAIVDAKLYTGH
ncbi:hypothetical protein JYU15_01395 [bacterium AH-315-I18]|nr:hypothetical protein [Phycisphaeraceae bacterium]MBN4061068.1 hypothetical protein [bacterium AH-315-I18]